MADPHDPLDLGIDFGRMNSYEDYEALWHRMAPVRATMIEKYESLAGVFAGSIDRGENDARSAQSGPSRD